MWNVGKIPGVWEISFIEKREQIAEKYFSWNHVQRFFQIFFNGIQFVPFRSGLNKSKSIWMKLNWQREHPRGNTDLGMRSMKKSIMYTLYTTRVIFSISYAFDFKGREIGRTRRSAHESTKVWIYQGCSRRDSLQSFHVLPMPRLVPRAKR